MIFVSYSRRDTDFAKRLAADIQESGFEVWWDQSEMQGGSRWAEKTEDAIEKARIFLAVLSPSSVASEYCRDEQNYALNLKKKIIPLLLSDCIPPMQLSSYERIDFGSSYEEGRRVLLDWISETLPSEPTGEILEAPTSEIAEVEVIDPNVEEVAIRFVGRISKWLLGSISMALHRLIVSALRQVVHDPALLRGLVAVIATIGIVVLIGVSFEPVEKGADYPEPIRFRTSESSTKSAPAEAPAPCRNSNFLLIGVTYTLPSPPRDLQEFEDLAKKALFRQKCKTDMDNCRQLEFDDVRFQKPKETDVINGVVDRRSLGGSFFHRETKDHNWNSYRFGCLYVTQVLSETTTCLNELCRIR